MAIKIILDREAAAVIREAFDSIVNKLSIYFKEAAGSGKELKEIFDGAKELVDEEIKSINFSERIETLKKVNEWIKKAEEEGKNASARELVAAESMLTLEKLSKYFDFIIDETSDSIKFPAVEIYLTKLKNLYGASKAYFITVKIKDPFVASKVLEKMPGKNLDAAASDKGVPGSFMDVDNLSDKEKRYLLRNRSVVISRSRPFETTIYADFLEAEKIINLFTDILGGVIPTKVVDKLKVMIDDFLSDHSRDSMKYTLSPNELNLDNM